MKYYHMGYTFNEAEKCNYIYCSKVDMHGLDQYVVTGYRQYGKPPVAFMTRESLTLGAITF